MTISYNTMLSLTRITLIICFTICLSIYISYKQTIEKTKPIEYVIVKQTQSYWRGTNYKIHIVYNRKNHFVSISRKMSDSIEEGKMPKLYYNDFTTSIISDYYKSLVLKLLLVLGVLFFLSFLIRKRVSF